MKRFGTIVLVMLACGGFHGASAQLVVLPGMEPISVFAGMDRRIPLILTNTMSDESRSNLRPIVFQTTSATAVKVSEEEPKTFRVLQRQTVNDFALISFPSVRSETLFLVEWIDEANRIVGRTEVWVYPTNVLCDLAAAAEETPIAVFDPGNKLKPLLKALSIEVFDLREQNTVTFTGRLAIIGPFASASEMPHDLKESILALTKRGVGVVLIQPPVKTRGKLQPSFAVLIEQKGAIVVAQNELVQYLSSSPRAQLNLIGLAQQALNPQPFRLPELPAESTPP